MNMRLEEYSLIQQQQLAKSKKGAGKTKEPPKIQKPGMNNTGLPLVVSHRGAGVGGDNTASSQSSFVSLDEPPKDYEMMLQKYEAEVRNHIKIEQQLKLHIECLQDKLEEADKEKTREAREREARRAEEESQAIREAKRYRELLDIREEEVDKLKAEVARLNEQNEELKG